MMPLKRCLAATLFGAAELYHNSVLPTLIRKVPGEWVRRMPKLLPSSGVESAPHHRRSRIRAFLCVFPPVCVMNSNKSVKVKSRHGDESFAAREAWRRLHVRVCVCAVLRSANPEEESSDLNGVSSISSGTSIC